MSKEKIRNKIEEYKRKLILYFIDIVGAMIKEDMPVDFRDAILEKVSWQEYTLTKMKMKAMTKRICKEEGLTEAETRIIMAVIACESGFDPTVLNWNSAMSVDTGICQFNNFWSWEKEKIIHPIDALNKPELAVKTMVKIYKKYRTGKNGLGRWVCWSKGFWKAHVNKI